MKKQLLFTLTALAAALVPSVYGADPEVTLPGSSSFIQKSAGTSHDEYLRDAAAQARSYTAWKISLAPVVAAEAMDAFSSRGLHELNPVLAGSDGQFGMKATLLKAGLTGALLGMEYLVVRKHPAAAKVFWKINVVSAAVTGGVAAHNMSLH